MSDFQTKLAEAVELFYTETNEALLSTVETEVEKALIRTCPCLS